VSLLGVQQNEAPYDREKRQKTLRAILDRMSHVASLEEIGISCRLIGPGGLAKVLAALERFPSLALKNIDLGFNDLLPDGIEILIGSPIVRQIEILELAGNSLGDRGVEILARGDFPSLSELHISWNEIGDRGPRALAGARGLPKLVDLNLRRNAIGDAGVRALCESDLPARLRRLNLDYNEFGSKSYQLLDDSFDPTKTSIW
jgi:hypothetical protein